MKTRVTWYFLVALESLESVATQSYLVGLCWAKVCLVLGSWPNIIRKIQHITYKSQNTTYH